MTILLPKYRERSEDVIERTVSRALTLARPRPDAVFEDSLGSPGEVVFYRVIDHRTYVWLSQEIEEGWYDDVEDTDGLDDEQELVELREAKVELRERSY